MRTGIADAQTVTYSELKNNKQLPISQIYKVYQDTEGYMWYGTKNAGLCRDDGYSIKTFRSDFNNPDGLASNWVTCITEDWQNRIWFGTTRGLYSIDKKDYSIRHFANTEIKHWKINAINWTADSTMWVAANNKILRYNNKGEWMNTYLVKYQGEEKGTTHFYEDLAHHIWIIQWKGGVFKYDPIQDQFISYQWPFKESPACILQDSYNNRYWISAWGMGLVSFHPEEKDLSKRFTTEHNKSLNPSYSRRHILDIAQDSISHDLWLITSDDLYRYRLNKNNNITSLNTAGFIPEGKKLFNQIISDKKGNLWVASDYPNAFTLSLKNAVFKRNKASEMKERYGYPAAPLALASDNGFYWFWQRRTGFFLYNIYSDKATHIGNAPGFFERKESPIIEKRKDGNGIFTFMDNTVLVSIEHINGEVQMPIELAYLPAYEKVHKLHATHSNLWIGTSNNLYSYHLKKKELKLVRSQIGVINDISGYDSKSVMLATEKLGICKVEFNSSLTTFGDIQNCSCITPAPDKTVWVGTFQGDVFYLDPNAKTPVSIKEECGLNGDAIMDIEVDVSGYVWILTNQRIIIYDPATLLSNVFYNSDPSISMNSFLTLYKDEHGAIHVGGMGGFCKSYNYQGFQQQNISLPLHLAAISINGNKRLAGIKEKQITLRSFEKNIELFFTTLNHLNADKVQYAFKIKGENEQWNLLPEGHNNILLANLRKGKITLEVKASDENGIFSKEIHRFLIHRLPAWYETTMAIILFTGLGIALLVLSILYYINKKKQKIINQQLYNSAIDLQELVSHLSEDVFSSDDSNQLNLKELLQQMKKYLQHQRALNENTTEEPDDKNNQLSEYDEKFIQNALNYVETNLDNSNYNVEQLSRDLGMDRTGLYRKLVSIMGKTPTSFIRSVRLKRAARLLQEGYTVAETADQVGFGTSSYLSKCFKDEYGIKPSEFIHKIKTSSKTKP